jgi:hypothetical protein
MGSRERRHDTEQIVFSVPRPLGRQLLSTWLVGMCVAAMAGGGFAIRQAVTGQWAAVGAWAVGVAFVPSLALALGTWSGSSRAFEVVYTLMWYLGPINRVPALDYVGFTPEAVVSRVPLCYLSASVVLLILAVLGRWRQMRR